MNSWSACAFYVWLAPVPPTAAADDHDQHTHTHAHTHTHTYTHIYIILTTSSSSSSSPSLLLLLLLLLLLRRRRVFDVCVPEQESEHARWHSSEEPCVERSARMACLWRGQWPPQGKPILIFIHISFCIMVCIVCNV